MRVLVKSEKVKSRPLKVNGIYGYFELNDTNEMYLKTTKISKKIYHNAVSIFKIIWLLLNLILRIKSNVSSYPQGVYSLKKKKHALGVLFFTSFFYFSKCPG